MKDLKPRLEHLGENLAHAATRHCLQNVGMGHLADAAFEQMRPTVQAVLKARVPDVQPINWTAALRRLGVLP